MDHLRIVPNCNDSDVEKEEFSSAVGSIRGPAPPVTADLDSAYEVMRTSMESFCRVYDVGSPTWWRAIKHGGTVFGEEARPVLYGSAL